MNNMSKATMEGLRGLAAYEAMSYPQDTKKEKQAKIDTQDKVTLNYDAKEFAKKSPLEQLAAYEASHYYFEK